MSKHHWHRTLGVVLIVCTAFLMACSSTEKVKKPKRMASAKKLPVLLDSMRSNEFNPDWLSLKLNVEFKTEKLDDSFKMFIRMRKDSVIWIQATYYAVEVARLYLTPDTVKFMDRKNKEFYIGSYGFFRDKYQMDFDFNSMQALVLGNSVGLSEALASQIGASVDQEYHRISNYKKKQLQRAMEKDRSKKGSDIAYSVWVDAETYKVAKLSVNDLREQRSLIARYDNHKEVLNGVYPHKTALDIINRDKMVEVVSTALKVQVNKPVNFVFNIPDKYERVL